MEIVIHGRHADIKVDFKDHVIKQSSRLEKFGVKIALLDVEVTHRENKRQKKVEFQIERYLNKGGNGMVFKTVDNKIIKISLYTGSKLNYEGKITEELEIEPIMKALYQGNSEIDFVIYNYLGEPVQDVIKKKK